MNRQSVARVAGFALAFVPLVATHPVSGAVVYWNGSGTSWNSTTSWSTNSSASTPNPTAVPGSGDTVTFNITSVNTAQTVNLNAAQAAQGLVFNSTGSVTLQGGGTNRTLSLGTGGITDNSAGAATIGSSTSGQQVAITMVDPQSWTNNSTVGDLAINGSTINDGSYMLTVGGAGDTTIGSSISGGGGLAIAGTGTVTLNGASSNVGPVSVQQGTLQMVGGSLPGTLESISSSGNGNAIFVQSGGINSASSEIEIGYLGTGTYNLVGNGVLQTPTEYIDYAGSGSFTQSGGTHTVTGTLYIGVSGGIGTYYLSNGLLSVYDEDVSYSSTGSFTQTGGTHIVSDILYIGGSSGAGNIGTYNLIGGLLSVPGAAAEYIGLSGSGSFTQTGGTNSAININLGENLDSFGMYQLSGSGLLSAGIEYVGTAGTGSFIQTGGTHTVANTLYIGYGTGTPGTYSLSGSGQLSAPSEYIGYYGIGSFTQSGGTHSVGSLVLAQSNGSVGSYNLNGGLLIVTGSAGLTQGSGSAAFNFSGGTLQAGTTFSADVPFILTSGGSRDIVFDTNGNAMILAGGMSGDGNLTKTGSGILILSGVSTCSGSTAVTEGILAVLADDASSSFTVGSGAGLFFDGATVHLNSSYVRALAGGAVQYQGATIVGGFLRGPGTQTLPAGSTNNFNATTFNTGATVQQNGNAAFIDVTNVGQLNNNAPLTWDGGVNNGGGTFMISNTATVSEWNNAGVIVISSSGVLNNHETDLTSYGGGQITINSGGTLNADSQNEGVALNLQDSLLVNNGIVTGTTNVNYGATVAGSGSFGLINVNYGGTLAIAPSASPVIPALTVSSGSITGAGQSVSPAIVADATITTPSLTDTLRLSGDFSGAGPLTKNGAGLMILSGTNSYGGGTIVTAGTLEITSGSALPDGTNLTIGTGGTLIFDPSAADTPVENSAAAVAVPEPGTLALLIAGAALLAMYRRRR